MNDAMLFDVETLFILDVAVTAVMACVALVSWLQHREMLDLRGWAIALFIGSVGALMICLRRPTSPTIEGIVGNVLIIAAYATIWSSIRRFNRGPSSRWIFVTAALMAVVFSAVALTGAAMHPRIVVMSILIAMLSSAAGWEVLKGQEALRARRPTAFGFFVLAVTMVVRGGDALLTPSPAEEIVFYDPTDGVSLFINTVCLVAVTLGFMMMMSERLQHQYESLASTDDLTGLPNRRSLMEHGERHVRSAADAPACVLLMDIDHFSSVNRQFGHEGGDRALVAFAAFGRARLRPTDVFARYGGEEFCAFLPGTDRATATAVAERLRSGLPEAPVRMEGRLLRLTVSVGVAEFQGDLQQSIGKADVALYRAKALGRNRVHCAWDDDQVPPDQAGAR